jgi:hypothetical protein
MSSQAEKNKIQNRILTIICKLGFEYNTRASVVDNDGVSIPVISAKMPGELIVLHIFKQAQDKKPGRPYFATVMLDLFGDEIYNLDSDKEFEKYLTQFISDSTGYMPDEYYKLLEWKRLLKDANDRLNTPCLHEISDELSFCHCDEDIRREINNEYDNIKRILYSSTTAALCAQFQCTKETLLTIHAWHFQLRYYLMLLAFHREYEEILI